jgi:hypothetical protein
MNAAHGPDRMEALASYGRQADDETLLKHAMRIKARAVDRCGELLREIKPAPGKRTDLEPGRTAPTRFQAAREAGLSKDRAQPRRRPALRGFQTCLRWYR